MTMRLVTGKAGKAHVQAADFAAFNAATIAPGEYVASTGNQFAPTLVTANKLHLSSGTGIMQGRHFLVDAEGVDLTIENGTQGQNRNDLVVARYEMDSNGIETMTPKVIKGTPVSGTAADPQYIKGDILTGGAKINEMPLYRLPLQGITVGTPVALFGKLDSYRTAWESISQNINRASFYGTCSTAAVTAAKMIACTPFMTKNLVAGTTVSVVFTVGSTAAAPTLNVNGTGAKSLMMPTNIGAGCTADFVYDGSAWRCIGIGQPTTYSTSERVVGCWHDGKPLYQKTIVTSAAITGTGQTINYINHGVSNLKQYVSVEGCVNGSLELIPSTYVDSVQNINWGITILADTTARVKIFQGALRTCPSGVTVTIKYIKTTD